MFLLAVLITVSCKKSDAGSPSPGPSTGDSVFTPVPDTILTNGVDLQPSYYNNGNVNFGWDLMKQYPKIKTVRIEIEPTVPVSLACSWIGQAITNGYHVIATYHKYKVLGSDNASDLTDAANWWVSNYDSLRKAGEFTINLMNEWGDHNLTSSTYANAYNNAISIVRQVYKGYIVIDCPGWGQETSTAMNAILSPSGPVITDKKIILSAHIYPGGWNQARNRANNNSDIDDLLKTGRTCIIGEFGNDSVANANWSGIITYARSKGMAVLAWSWNGDGGKMNMVTPSWSIDAQATNFTTSNYFNTVYSFL